VIYLRDQPRITHKVRKETLALYARVVDDVILPTLYGFCRHLKNFRH